MYELPSRPPILGFVILSHTANSMLARLLSRLNRIYSAPPIVIHHDHSQAPMPLSQDQLTSNVSFVKPHVATRWGRFSIVEAFLRGLEELYDKHSPDWFANLSASCYPVSPGSNVLGELAQTPHDALIGTVKLHPEMEIPDASSVSSIGEFLLSPSLPTHTSDVATWMNACYRRYVATDRSGSLFGPSFGCYAGDQWFTGNSRAASVLLSSKHTYPDLVHHYSRVRVPDESFCQTVLCNDPGLQIAPFNKRFVDWHTPHAHPVELTYADFARVVESGCHFARKFSERSCDLMDCLDQWQLDQMFAASGTPD
jgi:hypothetical protein